MNRINSNPTSRSPSRIASHRAHSQPSTPGLIHLSPAMLQPLQQQQQAISGAGKGGKRSKGANQRAATPKNSKASSTRQHVTDEGTATGSDADIFIDAHGQEAGKPRTPTPSMKRERRQQRQQEPSADSAVEDGSPAKGRHAEAAGLPIQRAMTPRRPKHKRGQSQATFAALEQEEDHSYAPANLDKASSSLLSKSAPTTSFLTRRTERQQKQQPSNIRSSNSADEWDMPLTANGHDALTWQQQSLGRKASNPTTTKKQQGNKNGAKKAGTFDKTEVEAVKPHVPSGISIMAPPPASSSRPLPASSHPTPVPTPSAAPLTWQQELFQRSGPSTPSSQLFTALEEGHSGAHPAKETRTRSSPSKARPAQQKNAYHSDGFAGDEGNLESSMSGLALNPSKTVAKNKQAKKAHAAAPLTIPGSVPKHHHYTRSSAKQANQRNAASDSDADNSVEEETANLSFGEEASAPVATAYQESTRPIAMAASPTKSSLYAGPKFHNSPSAGQLPTPRLAAFLNRNKESSPLPSGEVLAA